MGMEQKWEFVEYDSVVTSMLSQVSFTNSAEFRALEADSFLAELKSSSFQLNALSSHNKEKVSLIFKLVPSGAL